MQILLSLLSLLSCAGDSDTQTTETGGRQKDTAAKPVPAKPAEAKIEYRKISEADAKLLSGLGFKDANKDGLAQLSEQTLDSRDPAAQTSYLNIARLAGDASAIDGSDLDTLKNNPDALAKVIRSEAAYGAVTFKSSPVLKSGKKDFLSHEYTTQVYPAAYSRLMTLVQLGLEETTARKFSSYGSFGEQTTQVVAKFQSTARLGRDHRSNEIDRTTFGALLIHLEHPAQELSDELTKIQSQGSTFYLSYANSTTLGPLQKSVYTALQFLYPDRLNPTLQSFNQQQQETAAKLMREKYSADRIGPNTLGKIITDIQTRSSEAVASAK